MIFAILIPVANRKAFRAVTPQWDGYFILYKRQSSCFSIKLRACRTGRDISLLINMLLLSDIAILTNHCS
jgi:hypothetical protein